jgi:transposase
MPRRKKRKFSEEFKADAVQLVRSSGKTVFQVAKELDLTESALAEWVKRANGEPTKRSPKPTPLNPQEEIERLREELRKVRMERDFLKKAAAFFAKEST